jgi:tight adherence protein C
MTHNPPLVLLTVGVGVLALLVGASLLLFRGAAEQEIAHRIGRLRQGASVAQPRSSSVWAALVSLIKYLGNAVRGRMLSARDAEDLAKSLAAAGFEPSTAIPIFMGAKAACLVGVPALVYLGAVLLGYPSFKQLLYTGLSLAVGMMLPNWVVALIHRRYQATLRRGLPDALDLMVVCAEAGLGLGSAVERVAHEMAKSNRPVAVEFSLFTHEMHVMADRRIALANLAERSGQPTFKRLASTLAQTLKYGTPLAQALRTLAAEMRDERMIRFEERAGKLPALLVMPMMLFILPCLFIILMGKPVTQLISVFGHTHL